MDPRKLSELKQLLDRLNIRPKKSLSQNFLIEKNTIEKLLSLANVQENDPILEIGPGLGAITLSLLERKAKVVAIELDRVLASFLRESIVNPHFTLLEEDFLKTALDRLPLSFPAKVVANIPFQITSPIFDRLASHRTLFSSIHLLVQKDVAIRAVAKKGSAEYGPFSLFSQYYFTLKIHSSIGSNNFFPKPLVDTAYIELIPKETLPLEESAPFFTFIHSLFHKRRKMIRSSIDSPLLDEVLAKRSLLGTMRPQELSMEDLLYLFENLK